MPTVTVKQEVSWKRIGDLLCCAFEGGSNYWYRIERFVAPLDDQREESSFEGLRHLDYPINPGGAVVVSDAVAAEGNRVRRKTVTRAALAKGLQVMARDYPRHFADFIAENDDANTGDVFLQCVCFGEVLYG